jgi:hypothetical protein
MTINGYTRIRPMRIVLILPRDFSFILLTTRRYISMVWANQNRKKDSVAYTHIADCTRHVENPLTWPPTKKSDDIASEDEYPSPSVLLSQKYDNLLLSHGPTNPYDVLAVFDAVSIRPIDKSTENMIHSVVRGRWFCFFQKDLYIDCPSLEDILIHNMSITTLTMYPVTVVPDNALSAAVKLSSVNTPGNLYGSYTSTL